MGSDDHGTIGEVVRGSQGLPIGVRFGESLLLRYEFTPRLPAPSGSVQAGGRWREPSSWELIDLRTSEVVIDSVDAARVASERSRLSLGLRVDVSVELTGMTTDFDCTVAGNPCTNRSGTADDSWSGVLAAGDPAPDPSPDPDPVGGETDASDT